MLPLSPDLWLLLQTVTQTAPCFLAANAVNSPVLPSSKHWPHTLLNPCLRSRQLQRIHLTVLSRRKWDCEGCHTQSPIQTTPYSTLSFSSSMLPKKIFLHVALHFSFRMQFRLQTTTRNSKTLPHFFNDVTHSARTSLQSRLNLWSEYWQEERQYHHTWCLRRVEPTLQTSVR